jgi:glycosyltransferase involved in cell wall biosynthesis
MNINPLFSILIANYNNAIFLKDCLESVYNQTYSNWEIIFVDDCSKDDSPEIIKKIAGENKRIKTFINKENFGCGYTKAKCAKLAAGELCGFLDPDDVLLPNALEVMVAEYEKTPDAAIYSSRHFHCNEKMKIYDISIDGTKARFISELETPWIINHFVAFTKEKYDKTEGIDPFMKRSVDTDLYLKLEEKGEVIFINKCLYKYRHNRNSISLNNNAYKTSAWHLYANSTACKRRGLSFDDHACIIKPSQLKNLVKKMVFILCFIKIKIKQKIRLIKYYRDRSG